MAAHRDRPGQRTLAQSVPPVLASNLAGKALPVDARLMCCHFADENDVIGFAGGMRHKRDQSDKGLRTLVQAILSQCYSGKRMEWT